MIKPKFFIITTISDSLPFFKGQLNVLKESFDIHLVSSPGGYLDQMMKDYKVKGFSISMARDISPWNDIKSLISLCKLFLRERPSVVHGNTPKASLLSMLAGFLSKVPTRIYYVHGLRYLTTQGFKRKILITIEKVSCFFATDIVAVSDGVRGEMKACGITDKKIELIGKGSINGINLNYFDREIVDKAQITEINPSDFVFGFIGRVVKDKGINELVGAFDKLCVKYKDIKLVIVGPFEENDPIDAKTHKIIERNNNIICTGRQLDVRPFIKMMHVFVLPSYREGLCGSILEASSMKLPIIATDIMGIREVVIEGYSGKLIPPKNEEKLYESMIEFYENREKLQEYSENGRKYVTEYYEQNKLWENSIDKYKEIISRHVQTFF